MLEIRPVVLTEGFRAGVGLGACVVALAVLALTPALAWIPEGPLLGAAVLLPLTAFVLTGYRAGKRSGRTIAGALASGLAGAISGGVGGVSYVLFGKPVLNVVVGLVLGSASGALVGAAAALLTRPASRANL